MKTKNLILFIAIIFGLLSSCNNDEDDLNPVEFIFIGQGNLYGNGEENVEKQNLVISDINSWSELINKMNAVNNVSDSFTETNIDFYESMIIAIFDEVKGNGGHSIDITKIVDNNNKIIVTIENILQGDLTTVMTQPYHIVKISKKNKSVIFE